MSAIERSMIVVEMGNSRGSDATPTAPPAAPEAVTRILWSQSRDPLVSTSPIVDMANSIPLSSAACVISATFLFQFLGRSLNPASIGMPTKSAILAVRLGDSSLDLATLRSLRSLR